MITLYAEEITGDHQCGFRHNRITTDNIFCIRQISSKKRECCEAVHELIMDYKKAYDSVRREGLYYILIEVLATSWKVRGLNPVGGEIFGTVQFGLVTHPASYTIGTGSLSRSKSAEWWRWIPTTSSAEVKERIELFIYSPFEPSPPVVGWFLLYFTLLYFTLFSFSLVSPWNR